MRRAAAAAAGFVARVDFRGGRSSPLRTGDETAGKRRRMGMAKFVLVYTGGSMPESEEERAAGMAAWGAWFGTLGSAVTDPGNPFAASSTVTADGVSAGSRTGASGYTIVEAADLAGAVELAKGCPILAHGGTAEVHEALSM
jgi:hypothetical protein